MPSQKLDLTLNELYQRLVSQPGFSFLDSSDPSTLTQARSYMSAHPFLVMSVKHGLSTLTYRDGKVERKYDPPFQVLDSLITTYQDDTDIPLAIGWVGYEAAKYLDDFSHIDARSNENDPESLCFAFYDHMYEITAEGIFWHARSTSITPFHTHPEVTIPIPKLGPQSSPISRADYLKTVTKIQRYIQTGDIYQVNYTYPIQVPIQGSPLGLYPSLRQSSPAPFSAVLNFSETTVLSASPECFFNRHLGTLTTQPIKGTISRGQTTEEDIQNQQLLLDSEKDKAELLMIVDLCRHDLGKICDIGSIKVSDHNRCETFTHLHHLVSTISGKLSEDLPLSSVFQALFPGGSITGAPKIRATEIIAESEPEARGVYTGCIGYIASHSHAQFNIAIRSIWAHNNVLTYSVGSGIVADSKGADEWNETRLKAKGFLETVTTPSLVSI